MNEAYPYARTLSAHWVIGENWQNKEYLTLSSENSCYSGAGKYCHLEIRPMLPPRDL